MPLGSSVGTITTGIVEPVEDPVVVETGTPALPVEVPRIVSIPTVIPDELTKGVAASVRLERADETAEVIAGILIEGRRPVDESAGEPVVTEEVGKAPLVSEEPTMGIIGDTRPVVEVVGVDGETGLSVELVPGMVVAGTAIVGSATLVDSRIDPRLSVVATTTIEDPAGREVMTLAIGVTVEPEDSIEGKPLDIRIVVSGLTLLIGISTVGIDEAMITGED